MATALRRVVRAGDAVGGGGGRLAEYVVVEAIGGVAEGHCTPERASAGVIRGACKEEIAVSLCPSITEPRILELVG